MIRTRFDGVMDFFKDLIGDIDFFNVIGLIIPFRSALGLSWSLMVDFGMPSIGEWSLYIVLKADFDSSDGFWIILGFWSRFNIIFGMSS